MSSSFNALLSIVSKARFPPVCNRDPASVSVYAGYMRLQYIG